MRKASRALLKHSLVEKKGKPSQQSRNIVLQIVLNAAVTENKATPFLM